MIIKILDKIQKLEQSEYNHGSDKGEMTELCHMIAEHCADKDNFITQSANTMKLLNENRLQEAEQKQWLDYANRVFASYLAVKIYSEKSISTLEELNKIINYYRNSRVQREVASFGLYACSQMLNSSAPMQCYELTKEAFSMNPNLGSVLDINYCYEGKAAQENLTKECPFCKSKKTIPYYCSPQILKLKNNKVFPPSKLWMKCEDCNNYYTYNFPLMSVGEINGHYTSGASDTVLKHRFSLHVYNNIFNQLRKLVQGTDYLEIGVGNGEMLAVAQEFGYHTDAVEICKEDCERISASLNIDIKWCDVVDYDTDMQYDVIVMGDVFEHVTQPVQVMQKVKRMLKKDGILWLSTPNYNCAYARMQKFTHCMWHELNHYTYVSFETIKELLHSLGLEVVHYDMSERYVGSMELFIKKTADDRK